MVPDSDMPCDHDGMATLRKTSRGGGLARTVLEEIRRHKGLVAFFLVLCGGLIVHGLGAFVQSSELDRRGLTTKATVVAIRDEHTGIGDSDWTVITVRFTDAAGTPRRAEETGGNSAHVGDELVITYDPFHPERIRWDRSYDHRIVGLITGIAGLLFGAVFGMVEVVKSNRRPTAAPQGYSRRRRRLAGSCRGQARWSGRSPGRRLAAACPGQ